MSDPAKYSDIPHNDHQLILDDDKSVHTDEPFNLNSDYLILKEYNPDDDPTIIIRISDPDENNDVTVTFTEHNTLWSRIKSSYRLITEGNIKVGWILND